MRARAVSDEDRIFMRYKSVDVKAVMATRVAEIRVGS